MYDHTIHRERKHFCRYWLQAFSTEEMLKIHIKDCFKINGKQRIKMLKKGKQVKFKNFERKIKSPFMIYSDFESILVPEDNLNQKPLRANIKNMLLAVMAINQYVLIISLVSLLSNPQVKMLFTILSIAWSKKASTVVQ